MRLLPYLVLFASLAPTTAGAKQPVAAIRGVEAFYTACIEGDLGPRFDAYDAQSQARAQAAARGEVGPPLQLRSAVPGMPAHLIANPAYTRGDRARCTLVVPIADDLDGLSIEGSVNKLVGGGEFVAFTRVVGEPWALARQEIRVLRSEKMPESVFVVRRVHLTRLTAEKGGKERLDKGWDHVLLERIVTADETQSAALFSQVREQTVPAAADQTSTALARFNAFSAGASNDVEDPGPGLDAEVSHVPRAMLKTVWALEERPIGSSQVAATPPAVLPAVTAVASTDTLSQSAGREPKTVQIFAATGLGTAALGGILVALPSRAKGAYGAYMDARFDGTVTTEREDLLDKLSGARTIDRVGLGLLVVGSTVGTFSVLEMLQGSGAAADLRIGPGTIELGGSF